MTPAADRIEKQTIITRLAVSIYKMNDQQLQMLIETLEPHAEIGRQRSEERPLKLPHAKSAQVRRQMAIAKIFVRLKQLDKNELLHRLRILEDQAFHWVRQYPRLPCFLLVDFATKGKAFRSCIRDISANGVFIETSERFEVGQEVALCFTFSEARETMPFKIKGHVARIYHDGIGVQYEQMTHYRRDILSTLINKIC